MQSKFKIKMQILIGFKSYLDGNVFDDPDIVLTTKRRVYFLSSTSLGFFKLLFLIITHVSTGLSCPSYHNVTLSQMNITTMSWYPGWSHLCPGREVIAISPSSFYSAGMLSTESWIPPRTTCSRSRWKFSDYGTNSVGITWKISPKPNPL